MKIFFLFCLMTLPALSQELNIPLWGDADLTTTKTTAPKIGRNADPLSQLNLLPPPFPQLALPLPKEQAPAPKKVNQASDGHLTRPKEKAAEIPAVTKAPAPIETPKEIKKVPQSPVTIDADLWDTPEIQKLEDANQPIVNLPEVVIPTAENVPMPETNSTDPAMQQLMQLPEGQSLPAPKEPELQIDEALAEENIDLDQEVSDVYAFDIAGFKLKMKPEQVYEILEEKDFRVVKEIYKIPEILETSYEDFCRASHLYQVDAIKSCMIQTAQNAGMYYLSEIILENKLKREQMVLSFLSPFEGNGLMKIFYINKGNNSLGTSKRDVERKTKREDAFFDLVYRKYNYPDDSSRLIWGNPQDAYLKSYITGNANDLVLVLEDVLAQDEEAYHLKDIKKDLPKIQNDFSFVN